MKIRLLSDLHIEQRPVPILNFKKQADVCILAGDIGNPNHENYELLLNMLSLTHDKVFVITGNHEYYNNTLDIDDHIKLLCEDNVHFLQMDSIIYKNVKFMGCTLWSNPDRTLSKYMNDFNYIKDFNIDIYIDTHLKHKKWIKSELISDIKTCVITHHLPLTCLIDEKYKDNPLNSFFASDVDIFNADYVCYGHTHQENHMKIQNTLFYCNPRGYEHENNIYNIDYIFTIS